MHRLHVRTASAGVGVRHIIYGPFLQAWLGPETFPGGFANLSGPSALLQPVGHNQGLAHSPSTISFSSLPCCSSVGGSEHCSGSAGVVVCHQVEQQDNVVLTSSVCVRVSYNNCFPDSDSAMWIRVLRFGHWFDWLVGICLFAANDIVLRSPSPGFLYTSYDARMIL